MTLAPTLETRATTRVRARQLTGGVILGSGLLIAARRVVHGVHNPRRATRLRPARRAQRRRR